MTYLKMINLILIYKLLQIDLKRTLKAGLCNKPIFKTFKIIILNSHIKRPLLSKI